MEVSFTSVEFNAELFSMANNEEFETEISRNPVTKVINVGTNGEINFTDKLCVVDSIKIGKLTTTEGSAAEEGQAVVSKTEAGVVAIKLHENDVAKNTDVEIYYEQEVEMSVAKFDNKRSAFGEVILKYPVYAGGDEDSLQAESDGGGIKGYAIMDIYRARATTMPGFDSNYKSTVENSVTFSTMDPSKAQGKNGKVYDVKFFDLANSTGVK